MGQQHNRPCVSELMFSRCLSVFVRVCVSNRQTIIKKIESVQYNTELTEF